MSAQHDFYLARAAEARAEAEATTLENVRQRALVSEAAWMEMARRVADTERRRSTRAGEESSRDDTV
jgi:hypothetical protein